MIARLTSLAVACLVLSTVAWFPTPTAAAGPTTGDAPGLELVDQTFVVPGVDTTVENGLSVTLRGSALTPLCNAPDGDMLNVVSYGPVTTRARADEVIEQPGAEVDRVQIPLCNVVPAADGSVQIAVATTPNTETDPTTAASILRLPAAGVVPIGIEVHRSGSVTGQLITFIDRLDAGTDATTPVERPLQVAVAVAVDGGPTLQPDGTVVVAEADEKAVAELVDLLTAIGDSPLTISVRPELLKGLSESGSDLVPALRAAVETNATDVLAVPYVAMEPTAAAQADLDNTFRTQVSLGAQTLTTLLQVRPSRAVWFVPEPIGTDGVQLLYESAASLLALLPPAAFSYSPSDRQFLVPLESGSMAATPVDLDIAARLDDPGPDPTLTAYQIAAQVLLMRRDALYATQGRAPMEDHNMILSTTDGTIGNVTTTAKLVTLLDQTPQLSLVTASKIGDVARPIMLEEGPYEESPPDAEVADLGQLHAALAAVTTDVDATASMLPTSDARPAAWRSLINTMPSTALSDGQRQHYVDAISGETAGVRSAVVPPTSRRFTLGGRHSTLRLSLRNDGDTDLKVRLIVESNKLEIDDPNRLVLLPAGETEEVEIPVDARTNGEFPVEVRITTPEGNVAVTEPVVMTARVNALTGLGQLATGAFVLVLLTWWVHHFRQRRRKAAAAAAAVTP